MHLVHLKIMLRHLTCNYQINFLNQNATVHAAEAEGTIDLQNYKKQ